MGQYAAKYWKAILFYIILGVIGTIMGLVGSISSKYLIDVVTGYDSTNIWIVITVLISMALGNIFIGSFANRISLKINIRVSNEMKQDVFNNILATEWEDLSAFHSGDLLNRLSSDVSQIAGSILGWIPSMITGCLQFIGTLAVILYYDSSMAIIGLISAPITLIISKLLMRRMREYNEKVRVLDSEMMSFHDETFGSLQSIKAFNLIGFFGERLKQMQEIYFKMTMDYNKMSLYVSVFLSLIGMIVGYATFGWGVYRLWSGAITYGTMTLFLQLTGSLSGSFGTLVGLISSTIGTTTSARRVMDIVQLPKEWSGNTEKGMQTKEMVKLPMLQLQLKNLGFQYKGREKVLSNINFSANPGELIAIIGPSGQGKTTFLRILLGLLRPGSGEALFIDNLGSECNISAETRGNFAYVPQGNTIFSGTIADNLRMVRREATEMELIGALRKACAYDFVKELPDGINTKVGEKGVGLSEGQAQRIAIARALLREAPILLLDEATSALDALTEQEVLHNIMNYDYKYTCIITTHRQSVLNFCDRVYRIESNTMFELSTATAMRTVINY
ncbi:MAG: ABC-type multidrug transport system, ATPase and permease component [Herbinix sp.]|nr:ABC-type multidrug transport system, ATPase and permease component [Herbinix sp.]